MSKLTITTILLLSTLLLGTLNFARAQGVSAYFGLGSTNDSAGMPTNQFDATGAPCPAGQFSDAPFNFGCEPGGTIGSVFGVFGVDFMFRPHFGVNGEYAFRFAQANFLPNAGLKVRPGFYDFNAVYQPISGKRIVPVVVGGIGGARMALYVTQQCSIANINCTATYPAGINANHFQLHGGFGVKLYVKPSLFIKPQFDIHYVTHLTDQYGRDWVPEYTVSVGYTFGER
ncbi:MAG TPA: outer membrane beta-barrel protein [Rugosimonospora sp.]|nr:outer membrane beta-barrel protein [Rugosimonospora sp.]